MKRSVINQRLVELMDPKDREELGQKTIAESLEEHEARSEKELHGLISALLRRNGILYVHAAMFKKSELPIGYPDFSFVCHGVPMAWELKVRNYWLSKEQEEVRSRMLENGWKYSVIRTLAQAQEELSSITRSINLEKLEASFSKE